MTVPDDERLARALLTRVAEPGDEHLGRLIAELGAVGAVDAIRTAASYPLSPATPHHTGPDGPVVASGEDPDDTEPPARAGREPASPAAPRPGASAGSTQASKARSTPWSHGGATPTSWTGGEPEPLATAGFASGPPEGCAPRSRAGGEPGPIVGAGPVPGPPPGSGARPPVGRDPGAVAGVPHPAGAGARRQAEAERRFAAWRARLPDADPGRLLAAAEDFGGRLVCPGDAEWPSQLGDLGGAQPFALWVRGHLDLRFACLRSVAVVGSRTATSYGEHVAAELAAGLAGRGWCVVSGGAFGIDAAAHRGALAADGATIVVLACGVDVPYPSAHQGLFADVARDGLLVSELPPGTTPTRRRFLIRNRAIAALTRGTVVVEAARRSGALNTARHARDLHRVVMAVPGPVTSLTSAGCHALLREANAVCVTDAAEVLDLVGLIGDDLAPQKHGPVLERDRLDPVTRDVLDAVPAREGAGTARIAVTAGVDLDTALARLGALSAGGFVERCAKGWKLRRRRRSDP